jgi:hypothetical protein
MMRAALAPLLTAAALLVGLVLVREASGAARPARLAFHGDAPIRDLEGGGADMLEDVFYTPELEVSHPARLTLEITRGGDDGWVGVEYALVALGTGEVREGHLEPDPDGRAVLDRVMPGRYVVRLLAGWDPRGTVDHHAAPDALDVRVLIGGRSPHEIWLFGALLMLPPLASFARARVRRRNEATPPAGGFRREAERV